jgi:hypothetical protein
METEKMKSEGEVIGKSTWVYNFNSTLEYSNFFLKSYVDCETE